MFTKNHHMLTKKREEEEESVEHTLRPQAIYDE
jgi:hypothetical protein